MDTEGPGVTPPTPQEIADTLALLEAIDGHKRYNQHLYFVPYPKQKLFFDLGSTYRERLFQAGNRVGKSYGGAFEASCHATGLYPDWWLGKKFEHPTMGWVASPTGLLSRDVAQTHLCGKPNIEAALGTGMLPRDRIIGKTLGHGVTGAFDTVQVRHATNGVEDGISIIGFKSYEQGRDKFQGEELDWGWADEAPGDMDLYSEFLTRINLNGILWITATPYDKKAIADRFAKTDPLRARVTMSYREIPGLTAEDIAKKKAGYLPHEIDARMEGNVLMGAGRVFAGIDEEMIKEPYLTYIPRHWFALWGLDFGIGHPFGAVLILWDKDQDVIHVHRTVRMADKQPINHARAIKTYGGDVPCAWPQDGTQREKGSGSPLASLYKKEGLWMLGQHAQFAEGGYSTEAGIAEMYQRMSTGRFKVGADLAEWWEEFRYYSRDKDAQIIKRDDDLMSATRVAVMDRRHSRQHAFGPSFTPRNAGNSEIAKGVDFDPF